MNVTLHSQGTLLRCWNRKDAGNPALVSHCSCDPRWHSLSWIWSLSSTPQGAVIRITKSHLPPRLPNLPESQALESERGAGAAGSSGFSRKLLVGTEATWPTADPKLEHIMGFLHGFRRPCPNDRASRLLPPVAQKHCSSETIVLLVSLLQWM